MRKVALLALAVMFATLLVPSAPAAAQEGPQVEFLNPSDYTTNIEISDKTDTDNNVHLVAWVGNVPTNPLVEFEITSATLGSTTIDASRAGVDTWEAFMSVSHLSDGQYTLQAILYENFTGPGTGQDVDTVQRIVTLNREPVPPPPAANTVEITYPDNGGSFGIYKPKGKRANGVIEAVASEGTDQVRVLYTTSAPGTDPDWIGCGSGRVVDLFARARCTLAEETTGDQVTAVAAVANETPFPADPSAVADATGDAHRVDPYAQVPQIIELSPDALISEPSSTDEPQCPTFIATVFDQSGREVAAANVDVHVTGPDDQIRFGNIANGGTSPFQAPDESHVANARPAIDCEDGTNEGMQGDHNIPGADDPQHIESTTGTANDGSFTFALRSTTTGGTRIIVWADDNDDDTQQVTEASGGARLGWGEAPPASQRQLFLEPSSSTQTTGDCRRLEAIVKLDGNPQSGVNVDVHASGPNSSVAYCDPGDASAGRAPDQGAHVGDADDEDTRHLEGETDGFGSFIFGVTTTGEGTTSVVAWIDTNLDDLQDTSEISRSATIGWTISGERNISINASRSRVPKGKRVRFSGKIEGTPTCEGGQAVRLRAKPVRGGRFKTIKSTITDSGGDYSLRVRVRKSKRYFVVAPPAGACDRAKSRRIIVRAR